MHWPTPNLLFPKKMYRSLLTGNRNLHQLRCTHKQVEQNEKHLCSLFLQLSFKSPGQHLFWNGLSCNQGILSNPLQSLVLHFSCIFAFSTSTLNLQILPENSSKLVIANMLPCQPRNEQCQIDRNSSRYLIAPAGRFFKMVFPPVSRFLCCREFTSAPSSLPMPNSETTDGGLRPLTKLEDSNCRRQREVVFQLPSVCFRIGGLEPLLVAVMGGCCPRTVCLHGVFPMDIRGQTSSVLMAPLKKPPTALPIPLSFSNGQTKSVR